MLLASPSVNARTTLFCNFMVKTIEFSNYEMWPNTFVHVVYLKFKHKP